MTTAARGRRSGVENGHRQLSAHGRIRLGDEGVVQVAGNHQIHARRGQAMQGTIGAPQHSGGMTARRHEEVMVDDGDLEQIRRGVREDAGGGIELATQDPPAGEREVEGRVETDHQQLVVRQIGRELAGEVAPVGAKRRQGALPKTVQGNIVVAGNHDHRHPDLVDESAGGAKLDRFCPLRQIAGQDHEIGPPSGNQIEDAGRTIRQMRGTEVDVGDVKNGP